MVEEKRGKPGKIGYTPSSTPSHILMLIQIVCNAQIFLSRDLALCVTFAENLGGLRSPCRVRAEEIDPFWADEPNPTGSDNDYEQHPL
jgi:hypothetical protein